MLEFADAEGGLAARQDQLFDALAGSLGNLFDFSDGHNDLLFLDPTKGEPAG